MTVSQSRQLHASDQPVAAVPTSARSRRTLDRITRILRNFTPGSPRTRALLVGLYAGANLVLIVAIPPTPGDWDLLWRHIPDRLTDLYTPSFIPYVWSPVAALILLPIVSLGYWPYVAFHLIALALLRSPLLIALVLVSWGFWFDALGANTITFVLVAGVLALRGSRGSAYVYFALFLLMPRVLQLPAAAWMLWKDPSLARGFGVLFVAHAVAVVASGQGLEWMRAMVVYSILPTTNIGPTAIFDSWLVVGLPLAVVLGSLGLVGLAGLAASPYVLPQYLLMIFVDGRNSETPDARRSLSPATGGGNGFGKANRQPSPGKN